MIKIDHTKPKDYQPTTMHNSIHSNPIDKIIKLTKSSCWRRSRKHRRSRKSQYLRTTFCRSQTSWFIRRKNTLSYRNSMKGTSGATVHHSTRPTMFSSKRTFRKSWTPSRSRNMKRTKSWMIRTSVWSSIPISKEAIWIVLIRRRSMSTTWFWMPTQIQLVIVNGSTSVWKTLRKTNVIDSILSTM